MSDPAVNNTPPSIYPWQEALWDRLIASRKRLPHALLLRGKSGIGKQDFAQAFTNALLCEAPLARGFACGVCASCGWFAQDNHPDFRQLSPEQESAGDDETPAPAKTGKKTQISVAQVRELGTFFELSSHHGDGYRIALISPAEALNQTSANALLKMLEEPPAGVIFILVSHQPQRLLATITSRCHKVDMPMPDRDAAVAWLTAQGIKEAAKQLDYAGESPLTVLANADIGISQFMPLWKQLSLGARMDVFSLAPLCAALGMDAAIQVLQKWCYDLLGSRSGIHPRYHADHAAPLQALAERVDLGLLLDFERKLNEARKSASHPLNNELQLENILLNYMQLFKKQLSSTTTR